MSKPEQTVYTVPPSVLAAVASERNYQEAKWPGHTHTVAEYILIMEKCLADAKKAWIGNGGDYHALDEVRQIVAVGVCCMEHHGAPPRLDGDQAALKSAGVFGG